MYVLHWERTVLCVMQVHVLYSNTIGFCEWPMGFRGVIHALGGVFHGLGGVMHGLSTVIRGIWAVIHGFGEWSMGFGE
jgi:hypothetical protein